MVQREEVARFMCISVSGFAEESKSFRHHLAEEAESAIDASGAFLRATGRNGDIGQTRITHLGVTPQSVSATVVRSADIVKKSEKAAIQSECTQQST
jgi:hypothetical protein